MKTTLIAPDEPLMSVDLGKSAILIGCGAVAIDFHFPRIQALVRKPQLYMVETSDYRYRYLTKRWEKNPRVTVLKEIPRDVEFSIALIATPPRFHLAYFKELAGRADHVLIEKPLSITAEDAREIAALAESTETRTSVNLIRRLLVSFRLMRVVCEREEFGRLRGVTISEGGVFNWKAVSMGSFSRELNGGGVLADTGPHTIDLLFQVFDRIELEASYMDAWGGADTVEANCVLKCRTDTGVPITVLLSRNRNLSSEAVFEFEKAICRVPVRDNRIHVQPEGGLAFPMFPPAGVELPPIPYPRFFDLFYENYILGGSNAPVSPREGLKSVELIENAYRQAQVLRSPF